MADFIVTAEFKVSALNLESAASKIDRALSSKRLAAREVRIASEGKRLKVKGK